ncbi:MAG: UPF0276 protein [Porticoccaceae bacterium]|nr:MAG: UPF0276 protein [Porticoccaceae bacterium]
MRCGAGLGLRRSLLRELVDRSEPAAVDFWELAPENWIGVGGWRRQRLEALAEHHPLFAHGLSLSLGGPDPLDRRLLADLRCFLDEFRVACYSEHLAFCAAGGRLYELLPIPFTAASRRRVADRIRAAQDVLGRRIAVENATWYDAPAREVAEGEFLAELVAEADCDLLLDVNNLYVNACNHGFDPLALLAWLPAERIAYLHVAGHQRWGEWLVDTHGSAVADPVWALLAAVLERIGPRPVVLERDFAIPPLAVLEGELARIRALLAARPAVSHG